MNILIGVIIYIVVMWIVYMFSNFILLSSASDREFRLMTSEDNGARILALLTISFLWPITVPYMLYNGIFKKG